MAAKRLSVNSLLRLTFRGGTVGVGLGNTAVGVAGGVVGRAVVVVTAWIGAGLWHAESTMLRVSKGATNFLMKEVR